MQKKTVVVIGAGAVGCAIARELCKYRLRVVVVDRNEDVGGDASKSNSAIVHTGYDASPGTLESRMVVAANPMFEQLAADLDIPYRKVGAILPAMDDAQLDQLPGILDKAWQNGVYDVEYRSGRQLLEMEPELNPQVRAGLYIPRENLIDPFLLVVALAENALHNGAEILTGHKATGILRTPDGAVRGVITSRGEIAADWVVNAAGLFGDEVARMVGKDDYTVTPRKGQFFILDAATSCRVRHIVLPIPTKVTKGKLVCPTVHGNILAGPTAEDLTDKYDRSTTAEGLESVCQDALRLIPGLRLQDTIAQYAGLRPQRNPEGLRVDTYDDVPGFINLSGVRSTGVTASVALAKYVAHLLCAASETPIEHNPQFDGIRRGIPRVHSLPLAERERLIRENPRYGNIVCRCETVSEGEIVDAIRAPIPARSLDAVKRRVRAGLGRCQGGFCSPRVLEILARELGTTADGIRKNEPGSDLVVGPLRP